MGEWGGVGGVSYLQVLPPDVDGRKGQLHLLPAGVFMALVCDLDEDEEDPCCDAPSHQHEDPCWRATARGEGELQPGHSSQGVALPNLPIVGAKL